MPIAAGIALIVLGAILKFALTSSGKAGALDLHVVGVILILAGIAGMVLPMLIRKRSHFSRLITRSRLDAADDRSRTVMEHADGSETFAEHSGASDTPADGQPVPGSRSPWA
jgi:hypothetical protein